MIASKNIIAPSLPNFERFIKLFIKSSGTSITRTLQYEALAQKEMPGNLLDFGGGDSARYRSLVKCTTYQSINIDPAMKPTWITQVGDTLPNPKEHYDYVLSMNTFEHIYNVLPIIKDIHTSLKSGGEFVFCVPFLYPVHGHPDDFCRPTASWWHKSLEDAGFKDIRITPLLWGPFSTGLVCSGTPGPLKKLRTYGTLLCDLAYITLRSGRGKTHFDGPLWTTLQNHTVSYFIQAKK